MHANHLLDGRSLNTPRHHLRGLHGSRVLVVVKLTVHHVRVNVQQRCLDRH